MAHRKTSLPEKICQHCGRPFAWRKKWEKAWQQVKYCSEACRKGKSKAATAGIESGVHKQADKGHLKKIKR